MGLTDKQISEVIQNMVILHDTREQKNQHILDFFDENNIIHEKEKLATADYVFILEYALESTKDSCGGSLNDCWKL